MGKKQTPLEHEERYVEFLKRRLDSQNYRDNASPEEYQETKRKYEKAKFKLRMLRPK